MITRQPHPLFRFCYYPVSWLMQVIARSIAVGFFCLPAKRRESVRFYRILFPGKSALYHRLCAFYQFQNFTTIHLDRMALKILPERILYRSEGLDSLRNINKQTGAIILQSHLGNWDIAAHLLQDQGLDIRLLLYMGIKEKEKVEHHQKEQLRGSGIRIIGVSQDGGSPFDGVDGINHLRSGGVVSMTGDMLWQEGQRGVEVDFLGHRAKIPTAPYIFALLTGAPLLPFFTLRTGRNQYSFTLEQPILLKETSRKEREKNIRQAAQQYADLLAQTLRRYPFQWYHFDRFLA
ncbi:MAG: lauroyl acyltransferase [Desulfobulbus sp.]|nr:MAG: lauroyl acyltransferase [Desulfobulbus sp.]